MSEDLRWQAPRDFSDFTLERLCERIHARHRDKIKVQKPHVAVANLARIVAAVLELSNRKGFHATSLRDLALASGLSMGGLYSYFDTKDTLLLMILEEVSAAVTGVLSNPPETVRGDPVTHLRWLIETHIALSEAMQPWFVFSYMEAKAFPAAARRLAVESELATEALFVAVLEEGVRHGRFKVDDIPFTATLIKPLLQDWYVKRAKYRKRGVGAARYAGQVFAFVAAAIASRDPIAPTSDAPRRNPAAAG